MLPESLSDPCSCTKGLRSLRDSVAFCLGVMLRMLFVLVYCMLPESLSDPSQAHGTLRNSFALCLIVMLAESLADRSQAHERQGAPMLFVLYTVSILYAA